MTTNLFWGTASSIALCILVVMHLYSMSSLESSVAIESKSKALHATQMGSINVNEGAPVGEARKRNVVHTTTKFFPTEEELFEKLRNIDAFIELLRVDKPRFSEVFRVYYRLPFATNKAWSREYSRVLYKRILGLGLHNVGYKGFKVDFLTPSMEIEKDYWFDFTYSKDLFGTSYWSFNPGGYELKTVDLATSSVNSLKPPVLLSDDNGVFTRPSSSSEYTVLIDYLWPVNWSSGHIESFNTSID